jgi:exopolysaccharide biosynthesis polyprenyl glycosylphosphotransferase
VVNSAVWLLALAGTVSWAAKSEVGLSFFVVSLPLTCVLTVTGRYAARKRLHYLRSRGSCVQRIIAVGHPGSVADLVRQVRRNTDHGMQIVGACVPHDRERVPVPAQRRSSDVLVDVGVPILGGLDDVIGAVTMVDADAVAVLACPELDGAALRRLGWALEDTAADLIVAPALIDVSGQRISMRPASGLPLLHVDEPTLRGIRRVAKGVADRVVAAVALLVLAPLLIAIACMVKLTSPGPVIFSQTRVGRNGHRFRMWKFRTMCQDAESWLPRLSDANENADGLLFKVRQDPRITPVGRLLRKYSLDELPQLVNILRGQMSIVGPRPPLPSEVNKYNGEVQRRLLVKPGLTGLWQVSGRSDLSWDESVRLDTRYVENWSLTLDLVIVLKTFEAVLRGRGAY